MEPEYTYRARVVRWVDGDTVDLSVDCGFYTTVESRFRLYGIDTPERGQPGYDEATARAEQLAPAGSEVVVRTYKAPDKYGRFLCLVVSGTTEVNDTLVDEGLAKAYFGGTRT